MQRVMEEQLEQEYIRLQNEMRSRINIHASADDCLAGIKTVAGVDLAYWKQGDREYAVCCIVVLDYHSHEVMERKEYMDVVKVPYVPGCLAFREIPLFMGAKDKLEISPDLYVFDGNGYLHPRHMGLATHAGILLDMPTIGIAKSYYKVGNTEFIMPKDEPFAYTDICINGEVYGRVLRTQKGVRPVFLSVGNRIDLDTATALATRMVTRESHIPLPTRLADIMTHESRKKYLEAFGME